MIRLFNVYYPTRTLLLLLCEVLLVSGSFCSLPPASWERMGTLF
jgi:hypothetical protein